MWRGHIVAMCVTLAAGCTCSQSFTPDAGETPGPGGDAGVGGGRDAAAPALDAGGDGGAVVVPTSACVREYDDGVDGTIEWRLVIERDAEGRLVRIEDDRTGLGLRHIVGEVTRWHANGAWQELVYGPPGEPPMRREERVFLADGRPLDHRRYSTPTHELWHDHWTYGSDDRLMRFEHRESDGGWRVADVRVGDGVASVSWSYSASRNAEYRVVFDDTQVREQYVREDSFERCVRFEYDASGRHTCELGIDCESGADLDEAPLCWRWVPETGELIRELRRDLVIPVTRHVTDASGAWIETHYDLDLDGAVEAVWYVSGCGTIDGLPRIPAVHGRSLLVLGGLPVELPARVFDEP